MVISRLPQGGGSSGEYIFHISTNEPELQTEEVIITNGNTVNKRVKLSGGKATIKTNEGGNYTFICGMAKFEREYSYFGDYDVTLVLNTAYITIEGKVSLARPMDSTYQAPEGYDKPNSVDNFTVRVLDTDMSEDEALIDIKSFADGDDTLSFVVDITQHSNVKVEFSSEDGFITPESKYYTLGRKDQKSETITWVEKYAVLEVQREDPELLAEDVYLRWTEGGVPKEIVHHAANLTDKSQFIVKNKLTHTVSCGSITPVPVNVNVLDGSTLPTVRLSLSHALVPKLTSNTGSNGVASASSESNGYAWWAFRQDYPGNAAGWIGGLETPPFYVQYQFNSPVVVKSFEYNPQGYPNNPAGHTWADSEAELRAANSEAELSNSSSVILAFTGHTTNEVKKYNIDNNTAYRFYRLSFKKKNSAGAFTAVSYLQFYDA